MSDDLHTRDPIQFMEWVKEQAIHRNKMLLLFRSESAPSVLIAQAAEHEGGPNGYLHTDLQVEMEVYLDLSGKNVR